MGYDDHQRSAANLLARAAIITLSDTRTPQTDGSGTLIQTLLAEAGHQTVDYRICRDEPADLSAALKDLLGRPDVDLVLTTGGTGIARRDQTFETIEHLIDRPIPGFGELFRMLSWQQIGPGAMLSRAAAGVAHGKLLFAMPGSTPAVDLAMRKLILPELPHLLHELRK